MILITGGAGFIGSNLVQALAESHDVIIVDSVGSDQKWRNLQGVRIHRWFMPDQIDQALALRPQVVIHMGAISSTTETNADSVLHNNFGLSVRLWEYCVVHQAQFVYASSASTYGDGALGFDDHTALIPHLKPLNLYAWSKQLFDLWVLHKVTKQHETPPQWVGLKFFNVYGPREHHKANQSSVILQQYKRLVMGLPPRLFKSTHASIADGEQQRDFVWVTDCVNVVTWLIQNPKVSGIYNVGSGQASSFNQVVQALCVNMNTHVQTEYVTMPDNLRSHYQNYTCAPLLRLRQAGYTQAMTSLCDGVAQYVKWLNDHDL